MVEFSTMVFGDENFQLVSVKAVSNEYPLRGDIEIPALIAELARARRQTGVRVGTVRPSKATPALLYPRSCLYGQKVSDSDN